MNQPLIVCKLGSSTLLDEQGSLDTSFVESLASQISRLLNENYRVVLISSGAAACGRDVLGFDVRPEDMPTLQACAAAGQAVLIENYAKAFGNYGLKCAQILLTRRDVIDRDGYLNARNTFERLLELGIVPVVNENDSVSVAEFAFGDNDMLGAIVSALLGADLYVILSDVEGLFTDNPQTNPSASLIELVNNVDEEISSFAGDTESSYGTGGMASKIMAARSALAAGVDTIICHGRAEDVLVHAAHNDSVGTHFVSLHATDNPRKLWIGLAELAKGSITLDKGATKAVREGGASVLPVGIVAVDGDFEAGDVVSVLDNEGHLVGRGCSRYSSSELSQYRGLKLEVIERFTGSERAQVAIHRDELLVF